MPLVTRHLGAFEDLGVADGVMCAVLGEQAELLAERDGPVAGAETVAQFGDRDGGGTFEVAETARFRRAPQHLFHFHPMMGGVQQLTDRGERVAAVEHPGYQFQPDEVFFGVPTGASENLRRRQQTTILVHANIADADIGRLRQIGDPVLVRHRADLSSPHMSSPIASLHATSC